MRRVRCPVRSAAAEREGASHQAWAQGSDPGCDGKIKWRYGACALGKTPAEADPRPCFHSISANGLEGDPDVPLSGCMSMWSIPSAKVTLAHMGMGHPTHVACQVRDSSRTIKPRVIETETAIVMINKRSSICGDESFHVAKYFRRNLLHVPCPHDARQHARWRSTCRWTIQLSRGDGALRPCRARSSDPGQIGSIATVQAVLAF